MIRAYQAACAAEVARLEGTVSRYMGDGILVLFGYPQAHEDDAERAVRAGLGMVNAVAQLRRPGAAGGILSVRVGIATGLVVAGDLIGEGASEEEAILGETPNLAARLQAAALPDTVVIAEGTRALLGEQFVCEEIGPLRLKGFREPVPVWRVQGPRHVGSRFQSKSSAHWLPTVDREVETAWLLELWHAAARHRGRVAMLWGEAGIGKSRVAETLHESLGDACSTLRFQCSSHYENRALHPIIQQIELVAGIDIEDPAQAKLDKLTTWLVGLGETVQALPILASLLSIHEGSGAQLAMMSAERQKQETFELLLRLMRMQGRGRPLLIIFEDLHWADPTTREFLTALVNRIEGLPALAILTFRATFVPPWTGSHVAGRELVRLPQGPALELVEQVVGQGRMSRQALDQVVARTDGIPLFIEELTRAVLGLGLFDDDGSEAALPSLAIPSTLQDSLMARLDQLGPAKFVAQLASAIGREFPYPLLEAIAPIPADRLREGLDALLDAGLINAQVSASGEVYAFKHALVQEVAYQTLLRGRRREIHAAIAQAFDDLFPQRARDAPELLAHHWSEAGEYRNAVTCWLAAGERASERSEFREAIGHLRKGVDLVERLDDPAERRDRELALLLALGPVLMMAEGAGTPEVASLYSRAIDLCRDLPKSGRHFAAYWGGWRAAMDHRAGRDRADDLLKIAHELGDSTHILQAHHCQWATLYMLGEHEECCRHIAAGIAIYNPELHRSHPTLYGGHDAKVCALGEQALSCWFLGRLDESLMHADQALEWARSLAHVGSQAHAMDYAVAVHQLRRDPAEVAQRAHKLIRFASEQHLPEHRAKGAIFLGWAHALLGDPEGGLEQIRTAMTWLRVHGSPEDFPLYYEMFAEVCGCVGRHAEGLDAVSDGFYHAELGRLVYWNAELHRRRGELLLAAGRRSAAAAAFGDAIAEARRQRVRVLEVRALASLVRMRDRAPGSVEAAARLRSVYAGFAEGLDAPDLREARAVLEALP